MSTYARAHRLAVFTKNRLNPAYVGARLGADRVAARCGCAVTHYVPREPDDVAEQRALLETALAERPDAVLLAPTHATQLNDLLASLQAKGVPLLCFVSRPEGIEPVCNVGSDDRALARAIANHLFERIPAGSSVVTLDGHPNAMTTTPRAAGFRDAVAAHAGVRIAASRSGDFQYLGGKRAMGEHLAAHPRIDGVLAANDVMALGAIEAMQAAGRSCPIVGVNATPDGIKAIKEGSLLASAAFDAMTMACLAVEAAVRLLRGQTVPGQIMLQAEVVDRTNCDRWDRPYEARPLPEWDRYVPV
jgi:ribose transport system substrate-binding protein